jgi:ATP-binding cassette subfamily D (ALD) protein 3
MLFKNVFLSKKDLATFIGYNVVSEPFFSKGNRFSTMPHGERLEQYYRSGRMLVKLAEAIGRISLAGRELTRLAGYTERVIELMTVLEDLNKGVYQRTMVKNAITEDASSSKQAIKENLSATLKPNAGKIIYKDNTIV